MSEEELAKRVGMTLIDVSPNHHLRSILLAFVLEDSPLRRHSLA